MNSSKRNDAMVDNEKVVNRSPNSSQPALAQEQANQVSKNEEEEVQKEDTEYMKGWRLYMLTFG